MLELLEQLFRQVRAYVHSERLDRGQVYFQSAEHTTMQFDREAEDIIISGLIESHYGFEIITEERATFTTAPSPTYRIVMDPIDGSANVQQGIMTAGVAMAVLPIEAPVLPENVQWSLVGELFSGVVYQAQRGGGAFLNGRRCQVSETTNLADCVAGFNMDSRDRSIIQKLAIDEPPIAKIRRTGSSAMDVVYVASGSYDAYIDVGNIITGESFLASLHIVLEAGGVVSDEAGKPLRPITDLKETYSLVVANNEQLHQQLLSRIQAS